MFTDIVAVVSEVDQLYTTPVLGVELAVKILVLVVGRHPKPTEDDEVTFKLGGIVVPTTTTVKELEVHPVEGSVTETL